MGQSDQPLGLALSEGLGPDAEMPPWLLPLHDAMLIANTHRVRVGTVQAVAKATHKALAAENERLRTELLCAREDVKKWRGLAEVARVLANLEDRRTVRASRPGIGA